MTLKHQPCLFCDSSDAMQYNEDGTAFCYSENKLYGKKEVEAALGQSEAVTTKPTSSSFIHGKPVDLPNRALSHESCQFFGVWYAVDTAGQKVLVHNYCKDDGEIQGQKVRTPEKEFYILGKITDLFGKHLWQKPQDVMVITEGELDAVSVYQATKGRVAVTSLPNGASSAKKTIQNNLQWLEQNFKRIVIMFDNDEAGQKAAHEVIPLFSPGKCYLANLGAYKDANEVLQKGDEEHLREVLKTVEMWKPDGIVTFTEAWEAASKAPKKGLSTPFPTLTEWVNGIRLNELIVLGAGSGLGKTTLFKEFILHFRKEHNEKIGVIFLEEPIGKTAQSLTSKVLEQDLSNTLLSAPDLAAVEDPDERAELAAMPVLSEEDAKIAQDLLIGDPEDPSIILYNHFGFMDYEKIKEIIRYMVVARGCKYIFLDHITALVSGDEGADERRKLDYICSSLSALINRYDFTIFAISHLSKPFGKPHEEGGRVSAADLRGSQAIKQWAYQIWGLEKNQQDPEQKNFIRLRILKDRYSGQCVGRQLLLTYDPKTTRLTEVGEYFEGDPLTTIKFPVGEDDEF